MDARTVELGLPEACRVLGIEVPEVIWEDHYHEDPAENGDDAPAWVNWGEWAIHMHQNGLAYVSDPGDLRDPGFVVRAVRHSAWHELGHLFSRRLWQEGGPSNSLAWEIAGVVGREGIHPEEVLAEAVAQYLIVDALEPKTSRYLPLFGEVKLLVALSGDIHRMRMKALDSVGRGA